MIKWSLATVIALTIPAAVADSNATLHKKCFEKKQLTPCFELALNKEKQGDHDSAMRAISFACDQGAEDACEILENLHADAERKQAALAREREDNQNLSQVRDILQIKEHSELQNSRAAERIQKAADAFKHPKH